MKNKRGFTLIELLAVIVILGLLIAIAIPSITKYITESRKKTLATTISKYVDSGLVSVNNGEYIFNDSNVIYAIPIECIPMERGGDNPFGDWLQATPEYWAYVLVQYDSEDFSYKYGFTFKDSGRFGMYPVSIDDMNFKGKNILTNFELAQPRTGLASNFSTIDYWEESGFDVNEETRVKVLQSRLEGESGDGENSCTLHRKGRNYQEIEEMRKRPGTLINSGVDINLVFGKNMQRSLIEEIYTLDYIDIPTDAIDSWDASIQKNESVMAYITDKDKDNLYELYLAQEGVIIAPANSGSLFNGYTNLKKIDLSHLDTSNVLYMWYMFYDCSSLTSLDVSNFNTANVIGEGMYGMFDSCSSLKSLDLSNFNTSKVTTMKDMFRGCSSLVSLNISSFDTSNVIDMNGMFNNCKSLTSLDLSNFDTKKVINMDLMFYWCSSLKVLDLSNFYTSNVTSMYNLFHYCGSLTSLDVSNFDTSKATNMYGMFAGCLKLKSLNLSRWNTSNVTDMSFMFADCSDLVSLDLSNFNTSKVTNMTFMFYDCNNLISLNLSEWNTSNVTDMSNMFANCSSLTNLDISNFNTSKVTDMNSMFYLCNSLTAIDLSSFDTKSLITMEKMFRGTSLTSINLSNADFTNVTTFNDIFLGNSKNPIIYVKDEIQKNWFATYYPLLTNVKVFS